MDKSFYRDKILNLFSDTENYTQLPQNEDAEILRKIKRLVKNYENFITKKEQDYITNFRMKTSNLYGLPKTHKSKPPADLKIRPIVAGPIYRQPIDWAILLT